MYTSRKTNRKMEVLKKNIAEKLSRLKLKRFPLRQALGNHHAWTVCVQPDSLFTHRRMGTSFCAHDLWRRAAHLRARSELLLAHTWRPHAHHFSADSLFHGLPMCSVFRSKPKSHKHDKTFVSSLHSLALAFSLFMGICFLS
jgi:hypothetical protein